jgi:drug/metabolite transporter (DMT)-like permease
MYIGLNLTYASSFQMLRGSVIIFVALFSKIFLGREMGLRRWIGIFFIAVGLGIVGVADMLSKSGSEVDKMGVLIGDTLIILAQIITATQMVYEERFVGTLDIPSLQGLIISYKISYSYFKFYSQYSCWMGRYFWLRCSCYSTCANVLHSRARKIY